MPFTSGVDTSTDDYGRGAQGVRNALQSSRIQYERDIKVKILIFIFYISINIIINQSINQYFHWIFCSWPMMNGEEKRRNVLSSQGRMRTSGSRWTKLFRTIMKRLVFNKALLTF